MDSGQNPSTLWRQLHYLSVPLIVIAGIHSLLIGTDIDHPIVAIVGLVLAAELLLLFVLRVRYGRRSLATTET